MAWGLNYVRSNVTGMFPTYKRALRAGCAFLNVFEDTFMNRMPDGLGPQIKVRRRENVQCVVACPNDSRGAIRVWTQAHFP
jgi:hypothetical protein